MKTHSAVLIAALFFSLIPSLAKGQTWSTPDGVLTVTPPDSKLFKETQNPTAPFLALWESNDEKTKLAVMTMAVPPGITLDQASAEEGLEKEVGAKVNRLPTKTIQGHEVWSMNGKNPSAEVTQAIVRHENTVYKVMAATIGGSPDRRSISRFMDSLTLVPSKTSVPTQQPNAPEPSGGIDTHNLSKTIGGAGALLVIGLLLYFALRGKKVA
jgi:hypothetical protein